MADEDDWRDKRRRELHGDTPALGADRPMTATAPPAGQAVTQPAYRPPDPVTPAGPRPPISSRRRLNWKLVASGVTAASVAVIAWVVLDRAPTVPQHPVAAAPASCALASTADGLRSVIFNRARNVGGPNPAWLEARAATTTLRLADVYVKILDADRASAICAARLTLTLDSGVALPAAAVEYSAVPGPDARGHAYTLAGADEIIRRLVELEPIEPAATPAEPARQVERPSPSAAAPVAPPAPRVEARPKAPSTATKPAKSVAKPRTTALSAAARVRADASLTALDNTTRLLSTASSDDDPSLTSRIARDQSAFTAKRDKCTTKACVARAYRAQIDNLARLRAAQPKPASL